jgi:hypothetical protein
LREGITDYRYLQALEEALRVAREQGRAEKPAAGAAAGFLEKLRAEFSPDLTRYFGAWPAYDGGGENWFLKAESGLSVERLDRVRAAAADCLDELNRK